MLFSDAPNKANAAAETEKARERDIAPCAQAAAVVPQPRNTLEDEEEVELRMPGSLDFGFADPGGAAHETPGVGTVDPFDAVGVLRNLWRRMQVRYGVDKDTVRFVFRSV